MGSIQFGNSNISGVNFGGTNISCVMSGYDLIWPANASVQLVATAIDYTDGESGITADGSISAAVLGWIRVKVGSTVISEGNTYMKLTCSDNRFIVRGDKLYFNYATYKRTEIGSMDVNVTAYIGGNTITKSIHFNGNYKRCTASSLNVWRFKDKILNGSLHEVASIGGKFGLSVNALRTYTYDSGVITTTQGGLPADQVTITAAGYWTYRQSGVNSIIMLSNSENSHRTSSITLYDNAYPSSQISWTLKQNCSAARGMKLYLDSDVLNDEYIIYSSDYTITLEDWGDNEHNYSVYIDDPDLDYDVYEDNMIDINGISSSTSAIVKIVEENSGDTITLVIYGE